MPIHKWLIIFVFTVYETGYSQQNFFFERMKTESSSFEVKIFSIFEDSRGVMWVGTDFGLFRYDGNTFKSYNRYFPKPVIITSIFEEINGNLWMSTFGSGIFQFNPINNETKQIYITDPTSVSNYIQAIEKFDDNLFLATNDGLFSIHLNSHKIEGPFLQDENGEVGLGKNQILSLKKNEKGLWVGTSSGLYLFDPNSKIFKNYNSLLPPEAKNITALHISNSDSTLWIATDFGLVHFNPSLSKSSYQLFTSRTSPSELLNNLVSISEDSKHTLWLATYGGGAIRFNMTTNEYTVSHSIRNDEFTIPSDYLMRTYVSSNGIVWFGTTQGLSNYIPSKQDFNVTFANQLFATSNESIYSLNKSMDGGFWVGSTSGHIYKVDSTFTKIQLACSLGSLKNSFTDLPSFLFEDHAGNLWIGTETNLIKYIPEKNVLEKQFNFKISIFEITEDNNNILWLSTGLKSGLLKFNPKQRTHQFLDTLDQQRKLNYAGRSFAKDSQENIWISSDYSLLRYNIRSHELIPIPVETKYKSSTFSIDKADNILLASYTGTLYRISPRGELIDSIVLKTTNETPTNVIVDNHGSIWISTFKTIIKISNETKNQNIYHQSSGIRLADFYYNNAIKTTSNKIIFFNEDGLSTINPNKLMVSHQNPVIMFTNFKIQNKTIEVATGGQPSELPVAIEYVENITLEYQENNLEFEFSMINYYSPEINEYAYQLKGIDPQWITSFNNKATYHNLPPGEYTLVIKGAYVDGLWSDEKSLSLIILPPPWKTWWAYTVYCICFIFLLAIGRKEIINRERLKSKAKLKEIEIEKYHELDTLKSRFFANISHEFRTPLTLLLGPIEKRLAATTSTADKDELNMMHRSASRLLTLINQLLDLSRLEAGTLKLHCSNQELNSFVQSIASQFSSMADSKGITFGIKGGQNISLFFDSEKLETIITNLLSNAFKFTPSGRSISIELQEFKSDNHFAHGHVEIIVSDSGNGIEASQLSKIFDRFHQVDSSSTRVHEGTGIGLALTKELVELHGGTISVASDENGSRFCVKLPQGDAHLKSNEIVNESRIYKVVNKIQSDHDKLDEVLINNLAKPKVLIVEDNSDLRDYLRNSLCHDYFILQASDGKIGERLAIEEIPDLILSDLMMPIVDGLQLCEKIKNNEKTSHIPVILLTAKADIETKLTGLRTGADDYIAKPFDARELAVRIQNLIEGRNKLHQKFSQQLSLTATQIKAESMEERFLKKVKEAIESNISNTSFSVELLAADLAMSSVQVNRKLKALSGYTPNELIRNIRLERAASLLSQRAGHVADIAYQVGFNNLSYFSKCFKEKFGVTPSEYLH